MVRPSTVGHSLPPATNPHRRLGVRRRPLMGRRLDGASRRRAMMLPASVNRPRRSRVIAHGRPRTSPRRAGRNRRARPAPPLVPRRVLARRKAAPRRRRAVSSLRLPRAASLIRPRSRAVSSLRPPRAASRSRPRSRAVSSPRLPQAVSPIRLRSRAGSRRLTNRRPTISLRPERRRCRAHPDPTARDSPLVLISKVRSRLWSGACVGRSLVRPAERMRRIAAHPQRQGTGALFGRSPVRSTRQAKFMLRLGACVSARTIER